MFFSRTLVAIVLATTASASIIKRDAFDTFQADLNTVSSDVSTLDNAINAFPATGGTLLQALTIHSDAATTDTAVKKATSDGGAVTSITDSQAAAILSFFTTLKPIILDALTAIVTKKAAFAALPVGGVTTLVKDDLSSLSVDTKSLEAAIVAKAPASLTDEANSITSSIDAAFATAIAAYA